ncbi:hypothetical protein CAOG_07894 [Capsaspora owczarzaki ATCC 30864]|uniref:F-box domain-containing protein n=1 Tax=Capsaspora owczarzaki (strain ATCC 30864) TaxID=595528 RepID=A0A0D2US53_CAPO3|nr:hypothetical protein CAOG_07894 [Capsaspora owczarzaki ATCC 30864]KJE97796.1 hypothetical protein CAOG_007894 [Capsaspora owczarzaki ATCC 30864]|eukprot:XP_004342979.1 hypothetical protein CAOG_07894 [Capsaspora owczarzaki ATCC 30864]
MDLVAEDIQPSVSNSSKNSNSSSSSSIINNNNNSSSSSSSSSSNNSRSNSGANDSDRVPSDDTPAPAAPAAEPNEQPADESDAAVMRVDFLQLLPRELGLLVLRLVGESDLQSLLHCACVSRQWKDLAEDNQLWRSLCVAFDRPLIWRDRAVAKLGRVEPWRTTMRRRWQTHQRWRRGEFNLFTFPVSSNPFTISFDLDQVISGYDTGDVIVAKLPRGQALPTFKGHTMSIRSLRFVGDVLVTGSEDNTLRIWSIASASCLHVLEAHTSMVACVRFGNDGIFCSGSWDQTVKVWNTEGQMLCNLNLEAPVNAVYLLGHSLATHHTELIQIYTLSSDYSSASLHSTMVGHLDEVLCLQMDEENVVSGSMDKTIRVWRRSDSSCLSTLKGHSRPISCLQFNRDRIVSGDWNGSLRVWDFATFTPLYILIESGPSISDLQFNDSVIMLSADDAQSRVCDFSRLENEFLFL